MGSGSREHSDAGRMGRGPARAGHNLPALCPHLGTGLWGSCYMPSVSRHPVLLRAWAGQPWELPCYLVRIAWIFLLAMAGSLWGYRELEGVLDSSGGWIIGGLGCKRRGSCSEPMAVVAASAACHVGLDEGASGFTIPLALANSAAAELL